MYEYVTNVNGGVTTVTTNVLAGVWLDAQKRLHAINVSGLFLIEYYKEGSYRQQVDPDGIEVVEVLEPMVQLLDADVGARLLPRDTYWADVDGIDGILPHVTKGLNETAYVYAQTGPKNNWAFAIKRTWAEPWSLEIYWQHKGRMGVLWPYEVDWYYCDWPAHPQLYVLGDSPADKAPVLIPTELSAALMEDMDPPLHAKLVGQRPVVHHHPARHLPAEVHDARRHLVRGRPDRQPHQRSLLRSRAQGLAHRHRTRPRASRRPMPCASTGTRTTSWPARVS